MLPRDTCTRDDHKVFTEDRGVIIPECFHVIRDRIGSTKDHRNLFKFRLALDFYFYAKYSDANVF